MQPNRIFSIVLGLSRQRRELKRVRAILASLSPTSRTILTMYFADHLEIDEIADRLDMPRTAVLRALLDIVERFEEADSHE